jgi:hypothetical protein
MNRHVAIVVAILLGLTALLSGCGKRKQVERQAVRGTVVLRSGEKLNGSISFLPADGSPGPAATATLADGSYEFDRGNGPTAGLHQVIVKRAIPKGAMMEKRSKKLQSQESLPETEPKMEWTLTVNVTDDGAFQRDFTLDP